MGKSNQQKGAALEPFHPGGKARVDQLVQRCELREKSGHALTSKDDHPSDTSDEVLTNKRGNPIWQRRRYAIATLPEKFGLRLRLLRRERKLSKRELGSMSGLSPDTIKCLEAGKNQPRLLTAKRLAKALGISLADLAG